MGAPQANKPATLSWKLTKPNQPPRLVSGVSAAPVPNHVDKALPASAISIPVIASGGISSLDDLKALQAVSDEGIMGTIIGRALYEGTIDLAEAQKLVED